MRILVTGGAGYVGSVSAERLHAAGHEVTVLDSLVTGHRGAVPDGARLEVGSYGDLDSVVGLLERDRIEAVLHCGARSLVAESVREPALYYHENVIGGVALLDAMVRVGIARIVFSSTAAVYGVPEAAPIPEDAQLRPINPYGETKRSFEGALAAYGAATGIRSVTLRYFNVAGATERLGEDHQPESHLVPNVLRAVERDEQLTIFGADYPTRDGTCVRDYVDVVDVADAHLAAIEATAGDDPRTATLTLNLGNGDGFTVLEVLAAAERVVGRPVRHHAGARRAGDPPILVADATRAFALLGWRPARRDLDTMIGTAWAWRQRHPSGYGD
jgi:UDP-glucose 4-epimerase